MKEITYYLEDSLNLGNILIALNEKENIVFISLDNSKEDNIYNLKSEYPKVHLTEGIINDHIREIFAYVKNPTTQKKFNVEMHGSDLQKSVWKEIMKIPSGQTLTYTELAAKIHKPDSVRAVATACGKNSIAVIIPCHRVVSKSGKDTGYRWNILRKKTLLEIEKERLY
jgi:AraC family transcriptional regulator of adaptative response/methylated-DNA-[protein]-cysteine methyltransferase